MLSVKPFSSPLSALPESQISYLISLFFVCSETPIRPPTNDKKPALSLADC